MTYREALRLNLKYLLLEIVDQDTDSASETLALIDSAFREAIAEMERRERPRLILISSQ